MGILIRSHIAPALAVLAAAFHSPAQAKTPSTAQLEANICPLHPDQNMVTALQKTNSDFQCPPAHSVEKPTATPAKVASVHPEPKNPTNANPPSTNGQSTSPPSPFSYLVRNDWTDVGLLGSKCFQAPADSSKNASQGGSQSSGSGVTAAGAKGGSVSFTRDYAGNNKIWAAQAMAAVMYSDCANGNNIYAAPGGGSSGIVENTVGAYAQINSDYNSNAAIAKKNNLDTRTAGFVGEWTYLSNGTYNVVRLTPNVVFDNIKGTTAVATKLQYIPLLLWQPGLWNDVGVFNTFNFQFDPAFDLQYASATGHSAPLQFSGKDQSLRIGPELTFIFTPLDISGNFWSNVGINETFHPWYEAYNGRGSYWWANSIFYNITPDGNFAVTLSYNRGLDENSGTMTNQYVASLTGKY